MRTLRISVVVIVAAGLLMAGTQFRHTPLGAILPVVHAAGGGCSESTLRGPIGFQFSGTIIGVGPIAGVGINTYDGAGTFTATQNVNINGFPVLNQPVTGTYTVNPDCTGTQTNNLPGGQVFHLAFVIVGKETFSVQTDPGAVVTAVTKPVVGSDDN